MRELRSCDFCGGDAAGTFEIVPPQLEPTEAEQRRVVLCEACKARLEALLEPLLARAGLGVDADVDVDVDAGATAASQGPSDTVDSPSRSERTTDSVPGSGDDIERPGSETGTGPKTGTETETGTGTSAGAGAETGSPTGITVEPGDATTVDPDDRVNYSAGDATSESDRQGASELEMHSVESDVDADSDGETDDEGEDGSEDERTATSSSETDTSPAGSSESRSGTSSDGRTRTRSPSGSESESRFGSKSESGSASRAASESDAASHSSPAAETRGPPRAYSKVVRLLRNREFPMDRDAVESLAAGAYELENHEVEAIVDHAIERGEFRADGDQLDRP
ncbi:hypothetical protein [Halomontanus rarus]|uniref:hypothetical protein n=1 Tax=Halomontanus rarus TaxID=3034020 RepID=UPI001A9832B4